MFEVIRKLILRIVKFIFKCKQIQMIQKGIWKDEVDVISLKETLVEANDSIKNIDDDVKAKEAQIADLEKSHKYEDRQKIKKVKEELENRKNQKKLQEMIISNNKKPLGLKQSIRKKEFLNLEAKRIIGIIRDEL